MELAFLIAAKRWVAEELVPDWKKWENSCPQEALMPEAPPPGRPASRDDAAQQINYNSQCAARPTGVTKLSLIGRWGYLKGGAGA